MPRTHATATTGGSPFRSLLALTLLHAGLVAQTQAPVGQVHPAASPLPEVAAIAVPALDRLAIQQDDVDRHVNGQPPRFAIPNAVQASPTTHGTWEALDPTWSLWRLRIEAPNASHVNLGFAQFQMPGGARMQVYSSDYQHVVRPFDARDHSPTGQLWTPVVDGQEIVCEVYVPTALRPQVVLDLVHVGSGYRYFGAGDDALGTDGSGSCNVDVNCPQGAAWADQIHAVAAIGISGSIFCSGCMINNTAQDGRNFFLTAYHCGIDSAAAPSLVCYWNYERASCGTGSGPLSQFSTGATLRAEYSTSDFTLVELNSTPNPAWGVTYAGWNRGSTAASSAVGIHHPSGDVKKISFENQATSITSYGGTSSPGNGSHVRVIDWDTGTTEGGSSGSPLFDQNRRIVGQLHGGGAACGNNLSDYYGRFFTSWTGGGSNGTRLSNWLDPLGTGQTTLDAFTGGDVAQATPYGTGCYQGYGSLAQLFAASTFDLSGTAVVTRSIVFSPITNGFSVANGTNNWFTPVSADLNLGDDALSTQALPWSYAFPGGATNSVRMCSNGFLWLNGSSTDTDYTPTVAELIAGPARFCPLWMDLNPGTGSGSGGTCHYDVDPNGAAVYFTWNNVPAFGGGTGNTFQLVLRQNGQAEYRYRSVANQPAEALVGWTRGATATPPNTDLSTALPVTVTTDATGLSWTPVNRPILGTSQVITLANAPNPAGSIGLVLLGVSNLPSGVDLVFVGAPGCRLYLNASDIQVAFPLSPAGYNWSFQIPNTPSLSGAVLYTQGAALVPPGTNALGALTANGVELTLGTL